MKHHPDKTGTVDYGHFLHIQEAWTVLRNGESRKKYDLDLKFAACQAYHDEITRSDLKVSSDGSLFYVCRCGTECYVIGALSRGGLLTLPCDGCSSIVLLSEEQS